MGRWGDGEMGRWGDGPGVELPFRAESPGDCLAQAEGLGDGAYPAGVGLKARPIHTWWEKPASLLRYASAPITLTCI